MSTTCKEKNYTIISVDGDAALVKTQQVIMKKNLKIKIDRNF